jgi:metal-responsive CopG/Arc/MetJ family transcriptional regulator
MTRIAINLRKDLLTDFDECLKRNGYNNRTKGMQEALKEYIERHK